MKELSDTVSLWWEKLTDDERNNLITKIDFSDLALSFHVFLHFFQGTNVQIRMILLNDSRLCP